MNIYGFGGLAIVGALLFYFLVEQKPADVYDMPMDQAYSLLKAADLGEADKPDWSSLTTSNSGNGRDKLTWKRRTSHSSQTCEIQLAPFEGDAARTHVAIDCNLNAPSAGAAQGINHRLAREANIERIDAALTGRPFDADRAGSTSARWPGDGVDGSYATAASTAIKMDADTRRMQQQASEEASRPAGW